MSLSLTDPTIAFTILVILAPLFLSGWENGVETLPAAAVQYLLSKTMIASYIYLIFIVLISNVGNNNKGTKLSARDQRVASWFLMNGIYFNLFLDVVSGQFQMNDLMTQQYNVVEPRYIFGPFDVRGHSVFWTSMCELFFQSPFCLLCYYGYVRNSPWRRGLEIIVSCLQVAGVWWFYIPEAFAGFPHLGGWPRSGEHFTFHRLFYFYFGFWALGSLWVVVATRIALTAYNELSEIVEKHQSLKLKGN